MGAPRVSQKDVLAAIQSQTNSIDALVAAITASAMPASEAAPVTTPTLSAPIQFMSTWSALEEHPLSHQHGGLRTLLRSGTDDT